jgi:hypothetical protein
MLDRKLWPKSVTVGRVLDACGRRMKTLDSPGFCLACGKEQGECEPDARGYRCEHCGAQQVYGAEVLLMRLM